MTKPFRMDELIARLQTLMRRSEDRHAMHLEFGDARLYPAQACLVCQNGSAKLLSAELQIMWCLFRQAGHFVHRSALHAAAWGMSDAPSPDALDMALDRLRAALLAVGSALRIVHIHGDGHALRDDESIS
jgi:DNA-binding response OmpR family regulator